MNTEQKASKVFNGLEKLASEYASEGKAIFAINVRDAINSLPTESAAKLYDILCPPAPRSGTLDKVLGPVENIGSLPSE